MWWWVRQVERLAITREQGQSKRVRHCLGSEIRGVAGDGGHERASQVEELSYNRHLEATESIHAFTRTHTRRAMKTSENENRSNWVDLERDSGRQSQTEGNQGKGRSLVPVPEKGPVLLLRWPRPQQFSFQDGRRHGTRASMVAARHCVSPYRASQPGPHLKWRPQASRVLNMVPSVLICLKMAAPGQLNTHSYPPRRLEADVHPTGVKTHGRL